MSAWQAIATAPKDGTRIHARHERCPDYDCIGSWDASTNEWMVANFFVSPDMRLYKQPTHWQTLPSPPLSNLLHEGKGG